MPRPPNEKSKTAHEMYLQGLKLVEIAEKLNVPASTVRRWKCTQCWDKDKKKENERSNKKKANARKVGGQPGNQNAKGGRGNPHPNTRKHGAYSAVYWDTLDEDEKNMIADIPEDEKLLLLEQIQLFAVRERRIMLAINKYRSMKSDVVVMNVSRFDNKRSFASDDEEEKYNQIQKEKVDNGDLLPGKPYSIQTQTTNKDMVIARLEQELSTVQSKKTKAIEILAKVRKDIAEEGAKAQGENAVDEWISAVMGLEDDVDAN